MRAVINVAIGKGYERGQLRLFRSLSNVPELAFIQWQRFPPWEGTKDCTYVCKAAAFEQAIAKGYTSILWLDASVVVSGSLDPLFAHAEREGVYLPTSGYNCAQTCNDRILDYFQIDRDAAETIPDASSGCIAVDILHPKGKEFARMFIQAAKDGMFHGSRHHDGQSQDPRFLFHRQDQSAAGLIAHVLGIEKRPFGELCGYFPNTTPTQVVHFKGIA